MLNDFQLRLQQARDRARGRVRGRYAPSPTGPQHLGNLRTALLAWLQARLAGGEFLLRMEDLDQSRIVAGSAQRIIQELRWLGLDWNEGPDTGGPLGPYIQSERQHYYAHAFELLQRAERVYPCFCSRKDVHNAASAPHGPEGPVYPGTCRELSAADASELARATGRQPAWRFRVGNEAVEFADQVVPGHKQETAREMGDFVVKRRDGLYAYQLAVVVDDALMGVTDVVRGADLLGSTPRQIALYGALGLPVPRFWHVPVMNDEQGNRLAKRDGSASIDALKEPARKTVIRELLSSLGFAGDGLASPRAALVGLTVSEFSQRLRAGTEAAAGRSQALDSAQGRGSAGS